jgi:hypothetical protein
MEMAVKSMETVMKAIDSMEMAPGALPVPAGCRNRDFYPRISSVAAAKLRDFF